MMHEGMFVRKKSSVLYFTFQESYNGDGQRLVQWLWSVEESSNILPWGAGSGQTTPSFRHDRHSGDRCLTSRKVWAIMVSVLQFQKRKIAGLQGHQSLKNLMVQIYVTSWITCSSFLITFRILAL